MKEEKLSSVVYHLLEQLAIYAIIVPLLVGGLMSLLLLLTPYHLDWVTCSIIVLCQRILLMFCPIVIKLPIR
jgi:putative effector of murein hydrolase LrgA (UPF0299 family)